MKKFLALAMVLALSLALVACGGEKAKNGTYTATLDEAYATDNNKGWRDELVVVYDNGTITSATYESYNVETGAAKSTNENYPMEYHPSEWVPLIGEAIVAAGSSDKVDIVAGATSSSDTAIALLKAIEEKGEAGKTITVTP